MLLINLIQYKLILYFDYIKFHNLIRFYDWIRFNL